MQNTTEELTDGHRAHRQLVWGEGAWTRTPAALREEGGSLLVAAAPGSDFWRTTSYGFVHDDGHALLYPLEVGEAIVVRFVVELADEFDQAGLLLRATASEWLKAGLEYADGQVYLSAVSTRGVSDWSVAPVADWVGEEVSLRASRGVDAVTVRARRGAEPWRLLRVAPFSAAPRVGAGPMVCAPRGARLSARFLSATIGPADATLHGPVPEGPSTV